MSINECEKKKKMSDDIMQIDDMPGKMIKN